MGMTDVLYRGGSGSVCHNDVHLRTDKLSSNLGDALGTPLRPAIFDCDSATLDPTERTQPLHKGSSP
jgi:hypothetical protein